MNVALTKFQRQRGAAGNFQSRGRHSVLQMVISASALCYSLGDSVRMNNDHEGREMPAQYLSYALNY